MSNSQLTNSVAIVTGGSRGIGPAIARSLARAGARVALVARSANELEQVTERLKSEGHQAVRVVADITSTSDRARLLAEVEGQLGPVDILVNNAGGDPQRRFHDQALEDIEATLSLNLTSAVLLTRLILPGMLERGRGHFVHISSMAGRTSFPFTEAYGGAKDGLIGFSRILRADYRSEGVSSSSLILGPVRGTGVGERTAQEIGVPAPPKGVSVTAEQVGRAVTKAIVKDKAELVLLPGPGKAVRALMDRFPGLGPTVNRAGGATKTMAKVADFRQAHDKEASPGIDLASTVTSVPTGRGQGHLGLRAG